MAEYWIPYMWSKRALAKDIIHFIRQHNPKAKYLYDIFWGGGVLVLRLYNRDLKEYTT